jgi:hypothetical protein
MSNPSPKSFLKKLTKIEPLEKKVISISKVRKNKIVDLFGSVTEFENSVDAIYLEFKKE